MGAGYTGTRASGVSHAAIYVSTVILMTAINCQIQRQIDTNAHIIELSPNYAKLNFTVLALFFILSLGSKGCMSKTRLET